MILSKIITFKCFLKYRYPGHLATVSKYRLLLKYQLFVKRVIYEHEKWPSHVHHVKNYSDLLIFNQYVNCSNLFTIILIFNNQQICRQSILTLVISQTQEPTRWFNFISKVDKFLFSKRNWVRPANSNFPIPISLQPCINLRYFKLNYPCWV